MANPQRQPGFLQRIPLESISPRLAPWGLALHAALTLGGSAWGIREALVNGGYAVAYELYQAIGINTLLAFGLSTATVVTTAGLSHMDFAVFGMIAANAAGREAK